MHFLWTGGQIDIIFCRNLQHSTAAVKLLQINTLIDPQPEWLSLMSGSRWVEHKTSVICFPSHCQLNCHLPCSNNHVAHCHGNSACHHHHHHHTLQCCAVWFTGQRKTKKKNQIWILGLTWALSGKLFGVDDSFISIACDSALVCEC